MKCIRFLASKSEHFENDIYISAKTFSIPLPQTDQVIVWQIRTATQDLETFKFVFKLFLFQLCFQNSYDFNFVFKLFMIFTSFSNYFDFNSIFISFSFQLYSQIISTKTLYADYFGSILVYFLFTKKKKIKMICFANQSPKLP